MADVTPILINQLAAQTTLSDSDYFIVGGSDAKKITVAQMKEALGINALNGKLDNKLNIDKFSIPNGYIALNVTYRIGGLGFWPFLLSAGDALYFINVVGKEITDTLSTDNIIKTMISDEGKRLSQVSAIRQGNDKNDIRIKIICKTAIANVNIIRLRPDMGIYVSHYNSAS